jgi:RNA polymerase sigma factor (sigma-70 family)
MLHDMDQPASAIGQVGGRGHADPTEPPALSAGGFDGFFEAEHLRLLRALYLITGDLGDAEELLQEAFLKVWERWNRVRVMDSPVGYLYRTALNASRSRRRRRVVEARHTSRPEQPPDALAEVDERDLVLRALAALPVRQRAALVLTVYLGCSNQEAGRLLSVEEVTVRSLVSHARATLRERLGADDA